jgi:hypothetical protein
MAYAVPPAKAEISATPSPSNATAKAGMGKLFDFVTGLLGTTGNPEDAFDNLKILDPYGIWNAKVVPSVASNALTLTLQGNAANLAAANPSYLHFRSPTQGDGSTTRRKLIANFAVTLSNGSTLGHTSAVPGYIFCYAIDVAGVGVELAVVGTYQGMVGRFTTTAEGGGGTADSVNVMYSATSRANVPGRLIAVFKSTQTTAGLWAAVPTDATSAPFDRVVDMLDEDTNPDVLNDYVETFDASAGLPKKTKLLLAQRSGAQGTSKNLVVQNNAATPNTKVDVTADEIVLKDINGNTLVARTVSLTVDFGAAVGANGPDVGGAQSASAFSRVWVIGKPDGTIASLGSASATTPTLPTGYTFKALVSTLRSNGSTQFLKIRQRGNRVFYEAPQLVLTGGAASVETSVSVASFVPAEALEYTIAGYGTQQATTDGAGNIDVTLMVRLITGVDWMTISRFNMSSQGASQLACKARIRALSRTSLRSCSFTSGSSGQAAAAVPPSMSKASSFQPENKK